MNIVKENVTSRRHGKSGVKKGERRLQSKTALVREAVSRGKTGMWLSNFYLRKDRSGQGVDRQMVVEEAERLCRRRGLEKLGLAFHKYNADSLATCRALGVLSSGSA